LTGLTEGGRESVAREQRLTQVFVELADTLVEEFDVVDFLQVLTERCVELVDTDAAGLMLDDQRGALQVVAYTDESARLLELFELQREQGPCLECFATGKIIANIDLADAESRWPVFAEAARDVGFTMSHAVPLRLRQQVIGALNLFSVAPRRLSADHLAVVQGLADIATIGLLHERAVRDQVVLAEQLQAALNSRVMIEQAKGILAERGRLDLSEAFNLLRSQARFQNMRLSDLARDVINGATTTEALLHPAPPTGT
jgi:GAF domain-containing protein